jgi:hypothetical protein
MLDDKFVTAIADLAHADKRHAVLSVDGLDYWGHNQALIRPPAATALTVDTLTAVDDYLSANPDDLALAEVIVTVAAPDAVIVESTLRETYKDRERYLVAKADLPTFAFV